MGDSATTAQTRANAAPDSRSLRLSVCSLAELAHVDDLLAFFELSRGLGWARHRGDARHIDTETFHLVDAIVSGAVFTACNGSMPVLDEPEMEARPASGDRCQACEGLRRGRAGLAEIVVATEASRGA